MLVSADSVSLSSPVITNPVYGSLQKLPITTGRSDNRSDESMDPYLVELSSRKFIPSQGVNISAFNMLKAEDSNVHYFLQLYNLQPLNSINNMSDDSGIKVRQYVSGNTYIAASNLSEISKLENITI